MIVLGIGGVLVLNMNGKRDQGQGVIVRLPTINNDSGDKIVVRDSNGLDRTIVLGSVFARGERCGKIEGKIRMDAKIEYRLLPDGRFCAYDDKTSLEDIYIRVLP